MILWDHIVLCPLLTQKCLSSIPLAVSLSPFPTISLPFLYALWICRMLVRGIFRLLKEAQGRATPKKIQGRYFFLFFVNLPLAASLDTSRHDHLIKVSSKCQDKCSWGDIHKRKRVYILYRRPHTHTKIHEDIQLTHAHTHIKNKIIHIWIQVLKQASRVK